MTLVECRYWCCMYNLGRKGGWSGSVVVVCCSGAALYIVLPTVSLSHLKLSNSSAGKVMISAE